jgi:hypothetical protein
MSRKMEIVSLVLEIVLQRAVHVKERTHGFREQHLKKLLFSEKLITVIVNAIVQNCDSLFEKFFLVNQKKTKKMLPFQKDCFSACKEFLSIPAVNINEI